MKISLLGYMGSEKSAVGQELAHTLDLRFIDLDAYIEEQEQMKISEIFLKQGEISFRKMENKYLIDVLKLNDFVLSTGGGTPVFYDHINLINAKSDSFYLYASPQVLAQRLIDEKNHRPILAHLENESLPEFIAKHLFERNPFYQQALHTINTIGKDIHEVKNEIKTLQNRS